MEKETKNSGDIIKELKELEKLEIALEKDNAKSTSGGGFMTFGCC